MSSRRTRTRLGLQFAGGLIAAAGVIAGCGSAGSHSLALPTVPASPADPPSPPASTSAVPAAPATSTARATSTTPATSPTSGTTATTVPATRPPAATSPRASGPAGGGGSDSPCADTITLSLTSDKPGYQPGQTVHLTATLANRGDSGCVIRASAERGFSVAVSSGATVWRSGCDSTAGGHTATEPCAQFIALMPIAAGQRLTRAQDWSQQSDGTVKQVADGSYTAREVWGGQSATVSFTIG